MLVTEEATPPPKGLQTRTIAILATVGIHLLFALFLGIRTILPKIDKKPEIIAQIAPVSDTPEKKIQKQTVKKQAQQVAAAAPPMTKMLRSSSFAMTAVPEFKELDNMPIGLGQGNLGVGFGNSAKMGKGAMFFGQKVAGNMGVVFDVSGSMHSYVPIVVDEIKRVFRTANVVCVNSSIFEYVNETPNAVKYADADSSNARLPFLGSAEAKKMDQDLRTLPNCWFIDKGADSLGAGVEYLMDKNVKTIFVFSDFQDMLIGAYVEKLAAKARAKGAKVNLHVLDKLSRANYEPFLRKLSNDSGGEFAEGELLRRAGQKR